MRRAGDDTIAFDPTIKEYLKEIDEASLLTAEKEFDLARRIMEDNDPQAREQLVRSNLRLVVNIAKRYGNCGMSLGDLIEEGNLGLIKAVDYFDPSRGTRFSTYAAWWIKQSIKRALLGNTRPVHIPTYMVSLINQWRHTAADMESKLGRAPEVSEVAKEMKLSVKKANIIYEVVKVLSSVRDTAGDGSDDDEQSEMTLMDDRTNGPEDQMLQGEELQKLISHLDHIDSREADILKLHYGLHGHKPMSLRDIGLKMGLTRERIRQIQKEALGKLYEYMNEN